jgi:mRNA interferase MazF
MSSTDPSNTERVASPFPRRGDVVRAGLDPAKGSEQAGERPVLVVSPDFINERSPVILVAAITSKKTDRLYSFEALIEPPDGGLPRKSKVMLMHLRSIDKRRIVSTYGSVNMATMGCIEEALKIATGITEVGPMRPPKSD